MGADYWVCLIRVEGERGYIVGPPVGLAVAAVSLAVLLFAVNRLTAWWIRRRG